MADEESISTRLDEILALGQLRDLIAIYFRPGVDNTFAGSSFDTVGDNPADAFSVADLLALNLLDEKLGPVAIRRLLDGMANEALRRVPTSLDLWECNDEHLRLANALRRSVLECPGVGATRASKLCARKRPRLIPIFDSVVDRVLGIGSAPWWQSLRSALRDDRRREAFEVLGAQLETPATTLRLVDVSVWMTGSNATTARKARQRVGLSQEPLY